MTVPTYEIVQNLPDAILKELVLPLKMINSLYPEEIRHIFLSQGKREGQIGYRSLWLFTEHYLGELTDPMKAGESLNFDLILLTKRVDYIEMAIRNFNLISPADDSYFSFEFTTEDSNSGTLTSYGENCLALLQIYKLYVGPNLVLNNAK